MMRGGNRGSRGGGGRGGGRGVGQRGGGGGGAQGRGASESSSPRLASLARPMPSTPSPTTNNVLSAAHAESIAATARAATSRVRAREPSESSTSSRTSATTVTTTATNAAAADDDDDFLLTAEERRAKRERRAIESSSSSTSSSSSSSSPASLLPSAPREIRGYYYDAATRRYYRITATHDFARERRINREWSEHLRQQQEHEQQQQQRQQQQQQRQLRQDQRQLRQRQQRSHTQQPPNRIVSPREQQQRQQQQRAVMSMRSAWICSQRWAVLPAHDAVATSSSSTSPSPAASSSLFSLCATALACTNDIAAPATTATLLHTHAARSFIQTSLEQRRIVRLPSRLDPRSRYVLVEVLADHVLPLPGTDGLSWLSHNSEHDMDGKVTAVASFNPFMAVHVARAIDVHPPKSPDLLELLSSSSSSSSSSTVEAPQAAARLSDVDAIPMMLSDRNEGSVSGGIAWLTDPSTAHIAVFRNDANGSRAFDFRDGMPSALFSQCSFENVSLYSLVPHPQLLRGPAPESRLYAYGASGEGGVVDMARPDDSKRRLYRGRSDILSLSWLGATNGSTDCRAGDEQCVLLGARNGSIYLHDLRISSTSRRGRPQSCVSEYRFPSCALWLKPAPSLSAFLVAGGDNHLQLLDLRVDREPTTTAPRARSSRSTTLPLVEYAMYSNDYRAITGALDDSEQFLCVGGRFGAAHVWDVRHATPIQTVRPFDAAVARANRAGSGAPIDPDSLFCSFAAWLYHERERTSLLVGTPSRLACMTVPWRMHARQSW